MFDNVSSQIVLYTVTDFQLTGVRPGNILSGPDGETLIVVDETVYTYESSVTDIYECSLCRDILDIAFYGDDIYYANETGGIVKRSGSALEVVSPFRTTRLTVDGLGNFYGIHGENGLVFSDGDEWIQLTTDNSDIPTNDIYDLALDHSGMLWMATHLGLISWDWITFTVISVPDDLSAAFYDIKIDSAGNKWVASAFGGVGKYDGSEWTTFPEVFSPLQAVENLAVLNGNEIWTSDSGEGLYRYAGTTFEFIPYEDLDVANWDINRVLFGDAQDRLWIYNDFTPIKYLTTGTTSTTGPSGSLFPIELFPNPAVNEINLKIHPGMELDDNLVVVYNAEGRKVFSQQVISTGDIFQLRFDNQPPGIYQVVVIQNGNLIFTGRVSVQ